MGTEMKSPESCESSLRNRKKKENVQEKSVKNSSKSSEKMEIEGSVKMEQQGKDLNLNFMQQSESKARNDLETTERAPEKNFRIRLELDPMSIALFTLAVVTRFFRLSEPRNVV